MATVTLMWVGDLNQDKRMQHASMKISDERYRPKIIEIKENQKEIKIGRLNSTNPPNYLIESCINKRMISRNHATIERIGNGSFMLYDHSMNGTYVNYMRVSGGVNLKHGDIVCFGHLNGANLKPGEDVTPFFSDLKYQVYIGATKDATVVETSNKRQRHVSQSSSLDPSPTKPSSTDDKSLRSKKPISPQKTRRISNDDNEEGEEEISSSRRNSGVKKSNGQSAIKKHISPPPPPPPKKPSGSVVSKHRDNQRKQPTGRSSSSSTTKTAPAARSSGGVPLKTTSSTPRKPAAFGSDEEDDDVEEFHYDAEECSARPCKQPEGNAIDWIQCDKCTKWYHQVCLGLRASEADVEVYYCRYCKKH